MPKASSVEPLHLFCHDDQNEVQHGFFGHVTPLALAITSYHVDGIVNSNTAFVMMMDDGNSGQYGFLGHEIPLALAISIMNGIPAFTDLR